MVQISFLEFLEPPLDFMPSLSTAAMWSAGQCYPLWRPAISTQHYSIWKLPGPMGGIIRGIGVPKNFGISQPWAQIWCPVCFWRFRKL